MHNHYCADCTATAPGNGEALTQKVQGIPAIALLHFIFSTFKIMKRGNEELVNGQAP